MKLAGPRCSLVRGASWAGPQYLIEPAGVRKILKGGGSRTAVVPRYIGKRGYSLSVFQAAFRINPSVRSWTWTNFTGIAPYFG